MNTHPSIQLLVRDNGAGLGRDLALLSDALQAIGARPESLALSRRGRLSAAWTTWRLAHRRPAFDLNLMLEKTRMEFRRAARYNVLIPNPEYFHPQDRAALVRLDAVWVKTRHAQQLFANQGVPARYIGFTSPDRLDPAVPRQPMFFHGPGRSGNKGTIDLIDLWAVHPEWPTLTVVWRRKRTGLESKQLPPNVRLIREHLDDDAYRRLQNAHQFHLCPSQTEGYGHYLAEAMSCGAVVVTLDAEPMNELVSPERGILVPAQACGQQDLATLYQAAGDDLAHAIERCLQLDRATHAKLSQAARQWFEHNREQWPTQLGAALTALKS